MLEASEAQGREEDEALIRAFQAGDASAFGELYRAHIGPLYRFVRRLRSGGGDPYESLEDTCQKVMMAIHRNLATFNFRARFSTYLFTAAVNHVRSLKRRRTALSLDAPAGASEDGASFLDLLPGRGESPEEGLHRKELAALLREGIAALPPKEKEVFLLRDFEAQTFDEIATATGQTLRNVQLLKEKANLRLRRFLESRGVPSVGGGL